MIRRLLREALSKFVVSSEKYIVDGDTGEYDIAVKRLRAALNEALLAVEKERDQWISKNSKSTS